MTDLVFDLDDTLVHSTRAYHEVILAMGIDPELYASARTQVKSMLGSGSPSARNRLMYFKVMLELQGQFSPKRLLEWITQYESLLEAHLLAQWRMLQRDQIFEQLAARYRLSVLTNENTRTQIVKMRAIDPDQKYFSLILTSEEVGVEKPHPLIFETLLKRLNVSPASVLLIGDNWKCDIQPALQFNFKTIWTHEFEKPSGAVNEASLQESVKVTSDLNQTLVELLT